MQQPLPKLVLILDSLSASEAAALESNPLPEGLQKPQFRRMNAAVPAGGYDAAAHTVTLPISSEFPVDRWDGVEVLLHGTANIDTSRLERGISHLYNHNWDILLGRTTGYQVTGKQLVVTSKYGTNDDAKKREQDLADGVLPDVSLAYWILKVEVTEDSKGNRTYNVVRWMPYEWSSVTVPADYTVGLDRSAPAIEQVEVVYRKLDAETAPEAAPAAAERAHTAKSDPPVATTADDEDEEDEDEEDDDEGERSAAPAAADPVPADPTTQPTQQRTQPIMATAAVITEPQIDNAQRVAELNGLRRDPKYAPFYTADQFADDVANNRSARDAKFAISERIIAEAQTTNVRSAADDVVGRMSGKEQKQYSRAGAVRAAINKFRAGTFNDASAGLATEVDADIRKEAGARGVSGLGDGILTPGLMNERFAAMEGQKRTVTSAGSSAGAATNFVDVLLPPIELLRNQTVTMRLGARMVPGLHGTPQFTRQNAAASSSWMAEGGQVTSTDPGLNFFQMNPHRLSMASAYTKDFLALSNLAVDSFLAEDRYAVLALSLDYAALAGSGTNNVPLGLLNYTGLPTVLTGSTRSNSGAITAGAGGVQPTYVDLNAAEALISGANADNLGIPRWAGTPQARAMMRSILKFPGVAGSQPLMPDSKMGGDGLQEGPLGYDGVFSNQLPKNGTVGSATNLHALVLGIWSQMLIGDWDLNEIIVDNITGAASATYKIFEHGFYDINFRHIEAFVWMWIMAQ